MKKISSIIVLAAAASSLVGCGHSHTFAEGWTSNLTEHWHAATCEHVDERSEVAAHSDANGDKKCDVCGAAIKTLKVKNMTNGTSEEQQAIEDAFTKRSLVNLSGSSAILAENVSDLLEDNGDFLKLTTNQVIGNKTVSIEWTTDKTSPFYSDLIASDKDHNILCINYPGKGGTEGQISVKPLKVTCGKAVTENTGFEWKCNVKSGSFIHEDKYIEDLNKFTAGPVVTKKGETLDVGYDLVDYNLDNPYFKTNNPEAEEKQYYYVNALGKVIYAAPDGNWGLIADGDQIMEIYAGSELNIKSERYPAMLGEYVRVVGNMGQYNGNIQIGFITDMKRASKDQLKAEPTLNYQNINAVTLAQIETTYGHKQCVRGLNLSNALAQVTGKLVSGSLSPATPASGSRFTFKMMLDGGKIITIAYDYHTDKEGKVGVFNAIKALIDDGGSKSFTVKGTLRYAGDDSSPFIQNNSHKGEWQLTPFLADHCFAA